MTDAHPSLSDNVPAFVPALLAKSITQHASKPAVFAGDGEVFTYADLGTAAAKLADRLSDEGVGLCDTVLYCGSRGLSHLLTVLAAWRLGAAVAFAPPDLEKRFISVSSRVRPRIVVRDFLDSEVVGDLLDHRQFDPREVPAAHSGGQDMCEQDLAYLLPTSGTTGDPKVVAVPHTALARRFHWAQRVYPLTCDDVVLASSSPAFDFSLWESFAPLCEGAAVAVAPPGAEAEPEVLAQFMVRHGVTAAHFVPTLLAPFLDGNEGTALSGLRLLLLGGERLSGRLCRAVRDVSTARIWNQYGPTETCIDVLAHEVVDEDLDRQDVPIGLPIDGVEATVVDTAGRPVGAGGVGELHIGGALLAWGYLGMGAKTASQFTPSSESSTGGRLLETGDLVRKRHDGVLTYVARTDRQIKIRGVRVEPEEVEVVLSTHPEVHELAVVVKEGNATKPLRLVAHVVAASSLSDAALRGYLADRLPPAAVPSNIVMRASMPRLTSGKIDRGSLAREEELTQPLGSAAPAHSLTGMQVVIGDIWSAVLDTTARASTNFFEAGGTSLTAMRVVARIRRATGVHVPVRLLFDAPVLDAYAARVQDLEDS